MSEIVTANLDLPATTTDLRKLAIGTVVYLTGRVFTARERVYQHAIEDGAGMPAGKGAVRQLVPEESRPQANALLSLGLNLQIVLGPALGGVLAGLSGVSVAFGVTQANVAAERSRKAEELNEKQTEVSDALNRANAATNDNSGAWSGGARTLSLAP